MITSIMILSISLSPGSAHAETASPCCCACTCPIPTASAPTSDDAVPTPPPPQAYAITINEVFPNPVGDDAESEFIELRNASGIASALDGWSVADASGKTFSLSGHAIPPNGFLSLPYSVTKIVINNDGETITLRDGTSAVRDSRTFDASSDEGRAYAAFGDSWSWTDVPTPGAKNVLPSIPVDPSVPISGSTGPNNVPSVPVAPEPQLPAEVRTIAFLPNPAGSDEAEWIDVGNFGLRDADLGGASLDDGDGGSAAHVIPDGTVLHAGATIRFMKAETKLALNNDADRVRLIRRDGTIADDVPYENAPDGATYALENGTWAWRAPGGDDPAAAAATTNASGNGDVAPPSEAVTMFDDLPDAESGAPVSLEGVVVLPLGRIGTATAIMADAASGIPVFLRFYGSRKPAFGVGELLRVRGIVRDGPSYRYIAIQSQNFELSASKDPVKYVAVSPADLDGMPNGSPVRIAGTVARPGKRSFRLSEGGVEVRVDAGGAADIPGKGAETSVTGILRRSSDGNEVMATRIEVAAKAAVEAMPSGPVPAIEPSTESLPTFEPAAMTAKWRTGVAASLVSSAIALLLFLAYRRRKRDQTPDEQTMEPFEIV